MNYFLLCRFLGFIVAMVAMTLGVCVAVDLGDIQMGFGRMGVGFGLGFGVLLDPGVAGDVGSVGEYSWGGAAGTRFWIDPEQNLIGVFMVQSLPHRTTLASEFKVLTYQALLDD